jgi:hypothetical protein
MDHKKAIEIGFTCIVFCLIGLCLVPLTAADGGAAYYD